MTRRLLRVESYLETLQSSGSLLLNISILSRIHRINTDSSRRVVYILQDDRQSINAFLITHLILSRGFTHLIQEVFHKSQSEVDGRVELLFRALRSAVLLPIWDLAALSLKPRADTCSTVLPGA